MALAVKRKAAALDVGDVQQVLDQPVGPLGRAPDDGQLLPLHVAPFRRDHVQQERRAHEHGVDGIAQVVRNHAQHVVAGAGGAPGRVVQAGVLQRQGAAAGQLVRHRHVRLFERRARGAADEGHRAQHGLARPQRRHDQRAQHQLAHDVGVLGRAAGADDPLVVDLRHQQGGPRRHHLRLRAAVVQRRRKLARALQQRRRPLVGVRRGHPPHGVALDQVHHHHLRQLRHGHPPDGLQRLVFVQRRRKQAAGFRQQLKPLRRALLLGDVGKAHHGAHRLAAAVHRRRGVGHGERRSVLAPQHLARYLDGRSRARGARDGALGVRIRGAVGVRVMEELVRVQAGHLLRREAQQLCRGAVDEQDDPLAVHRVDAVGGGVQQLLVLAMDALQFVGRAARRFQRQAQLDLPLRRRAQLREHLNVLLAPRPRLVVDGAERADGLALEKDGNAQVGADAQRIHRGNLPVGGVGVRVGDHQRPGRVRHRVVAEGAPVQLAHRPQRLAESAGGLVEVAVVVHQRHEGGGNAQQPRRQPRQRVECGLRGRIQQPGGVHGGQALRRLDGCVHFGPARRVGHVLGRAGERRVRRVQTIVQRV
ncbi:MAG: hypothetical protein AVDCRST_MAG89-4253 [uncultured Gemmatimonadetes bacterium]|uniref:Uncharacterized protein n=1 Tax=uncultured Gemmatimonadota bacterium TaxID=203437 RepID=A0A6J4MSG0_9BACT|nr:MAG: hypothetical protein AVDCRST_MAG89-4253 [uncultured Gemmatimonadota bacterium]